MAVVEIQHLSKSYGGVEALRDVTVEIAPGVTGLLGPNGAGKSTLLLCVLGLLPDWQGEVRVLGLDARTQRRPIRRRVGFMPEVDAWIRNMTAIRAVRYLARLAGLPSSEALRRAHEVLWHVGLGEAVYRDLKEYSVGMRQRFKLAQALVHDPEILFLDEPLAGLDPAGRDELLDLVRNLATDNGKHVVWSSHILPEVQKVADAVLVLHEGRFRGSFRLDELQPDRHRFRLEVEGETERFTELAAQAGYVVSPPGEGRPEVALGRRHLTIDLPVERTVEDLFRLSRLGNARLRSVAPVREDLEGVFHHIIADGEAHS